MPTTKIAGNVSLTPLKPSTIQINKNGINIFTIANVNTEICETCILVTFPDKFNVSMICTGIPIAPNAPEAFAIKHNIAAFNGWKPSCVKSNAQIAIGTPNPMRLLKIH